MTHNNSKTAPKKKTAQVKAEPKAPVTRSRERDNTTIEGYELIKRIKYALNESGENSETALLQRLRLTRQYWNSFCNGTRPVQALVRNDHRRQFLAQYLGCSQLEIRVLAGEIKPDELVAQESDALWLEMEKMRHDSRWGMLAPSNKDEWDTLPMKYRVLIVSMYRTVTDTDLEKACKQTPDAKAVIEAL